MIRLRGAHDVAAQLRGDWQSGDRGCSELRGHHSKRGGREGVLHVSVGILPGLTC